MHQRKLLETQTSTNRKTSQINGWIGRILCEVSKGWEILLRMNETEWFSKFFLVSEWIYVYKQYATPFSWNIRDTSEKGGFKLTNFSGILMVAKGSFSAYLMKILRIVLMKFIAHHRSFFWSQLKFILLKLFAYKDYYIFFPNLNLCGVLSLPNEIYFRIWIMPILK